MKVGGQNASLKFQSEFQEKLTFARGLWISMVQFKYVKSSEKWSEIMLDPVKNRLLMSQLRKAEGKTVIDKRTSNRIIRSKISSEVGSRVYYSRED